MSRFPFFRQYDSSDCGPSCLRMISFYSSTFSYFAKIICASWN